jgi:hypothetical protein
MAIALELTPTHAEGMTHFTGGLYSLADQNPAIGHTSTAGAVPADGTRIAAANYDMRRERARKRDEDRECMMHMMHVSIQPRSSASSLSRLVSVLSSPRVLTCVRAELSLHIAIHRVEYQTAGIDGCRSRRREEGRRQRQQLIARNWIQERRG